MRHAARVLLLALTAAPAFAQAPDQPDQKDARVAAIFSDYTKGIQPGCAVGVMRNGRLIHAAGYGYADIAERRPITPDTAFNLASTSKQFTALAILLLAQDGALSLSDPVVKYVPELSESADGVTLVDLLHHTGGLRDYIGLLELAGHEIAGATTQQQAIEMLARQQGANFAPGAEWGYSNTGYFLLSLIAERVSGQTLRHFAEKRIFAPLDMGDTTIVDDYPAGIEALARGYSPEGGGFAINESHWEETGDGQVHTTIRDLAKWDENFYTGDAGGTALLRRMIVPGRMANGTSVDYGFGLIPGRYRGLATVAHGGAWAGYRSQLLRFPDQHFSVAVLCNRADAGPTLKAQKVAEIYLGPLMGQDEPSKGVQRLTALPGAVAPEALPTGAYRDPVSGTYLSLTRTGDEPLLRYGSMTSPLDVVAPGVYSAFEGALNMAFLPATADRPPQIATGDLYPVAYLLQPEWTPAPLDPYIGTYWSDELQTDYRIERHDGGLMLRDGSKLLAMRPAGKGEFEVPELFAVLRFENPGEPSGFVLATPDIRGLRFRRTRDRDR